MENIAIDKDISKIISNYRKLSNILNKTLNYAMYLVFTGMLIFGLFIIKGEIKTNYTGLSQDEISGKVDIKGGIISNRINFGEDTTFLKKYNVSILGGYLIYSGGTINSSYNMVSLYKTGFVLPYSFTVTKTDKIPSKLAYSLSSIDLLIKTFIQGVQPQVDAITDKGIKIEKGIIRNTSQISDLNDNSFQKTFDLKCLNSPVISPFCQNKVKAVISQLPNYKISDDMNGLKNFYEAVKKDYKDELCQNLVKYNYNSAIFDDGFRSIYSDCGNKYITDFDNAKIFTEINTSIKSNVINNKTYNDNRLNAYKLISSQRMIFLNKDNESVFDLCSAYLDFLKNLNRTQSLDKFYLYEAFVFNNSYMSDFLQEKITAKGTDSQKTKQIQTILDQIKEINNGDNIFGTKGLISYIDSSQKDILELSKSKVKHTSAPMFLDDTFKSFLNTFKSSYIVTDFKIDSKTNTFMSNGAIVVIEKENGGNETRRNIYVTAYFKYQGGDFYVSEIEVNGYPELNNILKNRVNNFENVKLLEIINIIKGYNFQKQSSLSFCDTIKSALKTSSSGMTNDVETKQCRDDYLYVSANGINYQFYFDNSKLTGYNSSSQISQEKLKTLFGQYSVILKSSFPQFIKQVVSIKEGGATETEQNATEIMAIINKIKNYLGTEPTIGSKNGTAYSVEIEVNGIKLKGMIDATQSYRLYDLSFSEKDIQIKGFSINLVDVNQFSLNKFKLEPLKYIASIDPSAVKQYLKGGN